MGFHLYSILLIRTEAPEENVFETEDLSQVEAFSSEYIFEKPDGFDDLGLDRKTWAKIDVTDAQPYMEMGVKTDENLRCLREGKPVANLYAVGSILSGHNSIKMLDGAGVDMLTALEVVNNIVK